MRDAVGHYLRIIVDLSFGRMVTDSLGIRSLHTAELPTHCLQSQGNFCIGNLENHI